MHGVLCCVTYDVLPCISRSAYDPLVVYVCNLLPAVTDFELKQLFGTCGAVDATLLAKDKFGDSKCWALVKFVEEVRV